jgi:hypothetical protein
MGKILANISGNNYCRRSCKDRLLEFRDNNFSCGIQKFLTNDKGYDTLSGKTFRKETQAFIEFRRNNTWGGKPGSSVSILSGYGLDDRAIEVRSPAEANGFFL